MPYQTITERDVAVVLSVYKYKYLAASQIERLHFPSETTRNRRLRRLVQHGYVKSFTVLNIPERLFMLTKKGAELVAIEMGVPVDELLWKPSKTTPKDYYFMRHFVAANDFRITLGQALETSDLSLRGFIPEYYGTRHASGRVTRYIKDVAFDVADPRAAIPHTPDAVFALDKGGKAALFFLEVDRGTESLSNPEKGVLKMIRFYLGYLASDKFKGYAEDFKAEAFTSFRVLIVTHSPRRIEHMKEAALRLPEHVHGGLRLLWATTTSQATPQALLRPVWTSLYAKDTQVYALG